MGLNYSFSIIAECSAAKCLAKALTEHLCMDDAHRLAAALESDPFNIMVVIDRHDRETRLNQLCFSFLFHPDEPDTHCHWNAFEGERGELGCIWSRFTCSEKYVLFHGTAATSGISRAIAASPNIQATFSEIGRQSGALLVLFNDEKEAELALWPEEKRLAPVPNWESLYDENGNHDPNHYCPAMLKAAGLPEV